MDYQDIINDDGTVTRWRHGAATTYASIQEARMAGQQTAMDTFAAKYEALRGTAQSLFDQLHAIERFLRANPQIAAEAQAAEAGAFVGGSLMIREQVLTAMALFANGSAFAAAEITPGAGFSNEDAVLRMG